MKIGLLTIHDALNYGALFQTYATQEVLSRFGKVEVIDYRNKHIETVYAPLSFSRVSIGLKTPLGLAAEILLFRSRLSRKRKFQAFWDSKINISNRKYFAGDSFGKYDVYVCGSDQVWNPRITNSQDSINEDYFLSSVPVGVKRISYASSFGSYRYDESQEERLKKLLSEFSCLSIREKDGAAYLEKILGKKVPVVLDPTLLLTREEWIKKLGLKEEGVRGDYILVYTVPRSNILKKAIDYYAGLGEKIISVDSRLRSTGKVCKQIRDADPVEFLNLVLNAKLVLTDSFHGVCFSINLKKDFIALSSGAYSNRMQNILDLVGLAERFVEDIGQIECVPSISEDKFDESHSILAMRRECSLLYLEEGLASHSQMGGG